MKFWLKKFNYKNLSINLRIQLVIFTLCSFAVFCMGFLGFTNGKDLILENTFQKLKAIRETDKKLLDFYIKETKQRLASFSDDINFINAIKDFKKYTKISNLIDSNFNYEKTNNELKLYYNRHFLPKLNQRLTKNVSVENYYPSDSLSIILQNAYLTKNKNEEKKLQYSSNLLNSYDSIHQIYHENFKKKTDFFSIKDIYLIDNETSNIIYSVQKQADFGRKLNDKIFFHTNLYKIFKKLSFIQEKNFCIIKDLEPYLFSYLEPSIFIGTGIFENHKMIGIVVLQISINTINNMIFNEKKWQDLGLGETGDIYLVGEDFKLRSNNRGFWENKNKYIYKLEKFNTNKDLIKKIKKQETNILLQKIENDAIKLSLKGKTGTKIIKNCLGKNVLSAYSFLEIGDFNWAIVVEKDEDEIFEQIEELRLEMLLMVFSLIIVIIIFSTIFSKKFSNPIIELKDSLLILSKGKIPKKLEKKYNDEIGETILALNELSDGLKNSKEFALKIGEGNFNAEYIISKDNDFGNALLQMRNKLKESKEKEEIRESQKRKENWINEGVNQIGKILYKDSNNLKDLTKNILSLIINYLNANQGAFFLIQKDENANKFIEMSACIAYQRDKNINEKMDISEGLVGRCIYEKKTIILKKLPYDYIKISSGLGDDKPSSLILVPLKINNDVFGVIEIASFVHLKDHEIRFLENIAENIASSISNEKMHIQTNILLKKSQEQKKELMLREEELRQNIEELHTTQELANHKTNEIQNILNAIDASIFMAQFNENGIVLDINLSYVKLFQLKKEEIIGKHHLEFSKLPKEKYNKLWNNLKKGEIIKRRQSFIHEKRKKYFSETYFPIIKNNKLEKIILIAFETNNKIRLEKELDLKEKKIKELSKKILNLKF